MTLGSAVFAFLAGILSTLSPCVLPLLPIVLGAAVCEHRFGPAALAAGLALSFVAIGLLLATVGQTVGLDANALRGAGAVLIIGIGLILMVPALQSRLATAIGPVSGWSERRFGGFDTGGLKGQFALGLLLGLVWSPCVGPTLGAASVLAAQGKDLASVSLVMAAFGLGAGLPLLLLGTLSREAMLAWRGRLMSAGRGGKMLLGAVLLSLGLLVASGLDKRLETLIVEASPDWLTDLTTRF